METELEHKKENDPPNPGSPEAILQGCLCPPKDNLFGKGIPLLSGGNPRFYINLDCPLHGGYKVGKKRNEVRD